MFYRLSRRRKPSLRHAVAAAVIWLNEKAEDFVLYGELEKAFFRNHRKLDVSCIVERDLYGHQLESNPSVREAAPPFKVGTMAAVAGTMSEIRDPKVLLTGC